MADYCQVAHPWQFMALAADPTNIFPFLRRVIDNLLKINPGVIKLRSMINTSEHPTVPKIGQRNTKQRAAVISTLDSVDEFASAQDIHARLGNEGHKVGLTTVYRTLQHLSELGAIDTLNDETGETLYRRCATEAHHHHLVCTSCRTTVEIDGGPVEDWATRTASTHGFHKTGHTAEVFGLCADCYAKKQGN